MHCCIESWIWFISICASLVVDACRFIQTCTIYVFKQAYTVYRKQNHCTMSIWKTQQRKTGNTKTILWQAANEWTPNIKQQLLSVNLEQYHFWLIMWFHVKIASNIVTSQHRNSTKLKKHTTWFCDYVIAWHPASGHNKIIILKRNIWKETLMHTVLNVHIHIYRFFRHFSSKFELFSCC